jgi:hypothetical protein
LSSAKSHTIKHGAWCFRQLRDMWGEPQRRHGSLPVAPDVAYKGQKDLRETASISKQKLLKPSWVRVGFLAAGCGA